MARRLPTGPVEAGTRYNSWTVIYEVDKRGYERRFLCRCICGTEKPVLWRSIATGASRSCGCSVAKGTPARDRIVKAQHEKAGVTELGRKCGTCDRWLAWRMFTAQISGLNGRASNCLDCARNRLLRVKYGVTPVEWEFLFESQGGVCAICEEVDEDQNLCVDHDHECCPHKSACANCIRGLLCGSCNMMLGWAEKREKPRQLFADYLVRRPLANLVCVIA